MNMTNCHAEIPVKMQDQTGADSRTGGTSPNKTLNFSLIFLGKSHGMLVCYL